MSVVTKLKRLFLDPEKVSNLGHEAWRVTEGLDRQLAIMESTPLTIGAFLRGAVTPPDVAAAKRLLTDLEVALAGGDHLFTMMNDTHSLSSWAEQLRAVIERVSTYSRGGVSAR